MARFQPPGSCICRRPIASAAKASRGASSQSGCPMPGMSNASSTPIDHGQRDQHQECQDQQFPHPVTLGVMSTGTGFGGFQTIELGVDVPQSIGGPRKKVAPPGDLSDFLEANIFVAGGLGRIALHGDLARSRWYGS